MVSSVALEPRLRLEEKADVAAPLELSILDPELRLVDLAVLGIHDGPALVAIPAEGEVPDDHEPHDGFVLVGARTRGAGLRLALLFGRRPPGRAQPRASRSAPLEPRAVSFLPSSHFSTLVIFEPCSPAKMVPMTTGLTSPRPSPCESCR